MTKLDGNTNYALLVYDIPSRVKLRNPSALLRRWAARINKSCWVLPLSNLALVPMKEWVEAGAEVEVVEFSEGDRDKCIALARRAIGREVEAMRKFVDRMVGTVRKKLAAAKALGTGTPERQAALDKVEAYTYASLYRAKGIADAAEECALHFDLTAEIGVLVDGLRKGIKAKAALFYNMQTDAKVTNELMMAGIAVPALDEEVQS